MNTYLLHAGRRMTLGGRISSQPFATAKRKIIEANGLVLNDLIFQIILMAHSHTCNKQTGTSETLKKGCFFKGTVHRGGVSILRWRCRVGLPTFFQESSRI